MRRVLTILALAMMALALDANPVRSQTVRGKIERSGPSGIYPAAHLQVILSSRDGRNASRAYTGIDGMYYFYNVPPGQYTLQISTPGGRPTSALVRVSPGRLTDVPVIKIR